jgi:hypothetical protein
MPKTIWKPWLSILMAEFVKRHERFEFELTERDFEFAVAKAFGNGWYQKLRSMAPGEFKKLFLEDKKDTPEGRYVLLCLRHLKPHLDRHKIGPVKLFDYGRGAGGSKDGSHSSCRHK